MTREEINADKVEQRAGSTQSENPFPLPTAQINLLPAISPQLTQYSSFIFNNLFDLIHLLRQAEADAAFFQLLEQFNFGEEKKENKAKG